MITLSGPEVFFWLAIVVILEVSIHFRFRPLKIQLATIEVLLRRDGTATTETLAEHEDRIGVAEEKIEALEAKIDVHLRRE